MDDEARVNKFGFILFTLFFSIAWINFIKSKIVVSILLYILDLIIFLIIILKPELLAQVYKVLILLSRIIGWINTRILLFILYYIIVVPMGIAIKILRKDFLNMNFNKKSNSYWSLHEYIRKSKKDRYSMQF